MNPSLRYHISLFFLCIFIFTSITTLKAPDSLISSIQKNDILSVKKELTSGANPNGCSPKTPLMVAAENGNYELVKLVLEHGADVNAVEGCGWPATGTSVLGFALKGMSLETIKLLVQAGAQCSTWITEPLTIPHTSLTIRNPTLLMYIVHQLALNKQNPVAEKKFYEIFNYFITLGIDVDQKDLFNTATPLTLAVSHGMSHIVNHLLNAGASLPSSDIAPGISLTKLAQLSNDKKTELLIQEALSTTYYTRWLIIILIFCGLLMLIIIKPRIIPKNKKSH